MRLNFRVWSLAVCRLPCSQSGSELFRSVRSSARSMPLESDLRKDIESGRFQISLHRVVAERDGVEQHALPCELASTMYLTALVVLNEISYMVVAAPNRRLPNEEVAAVNNTDVSSQQDRFRVST